MRPPSDEQILLLVKAQGLLDEGLFVARKYALLLSIYRLCNSPVPFYLGDLQVHLKSPADLNAKTS
jgi:hypothetical protein